MDKVFLYYFRFLGRHNEWFALRAPTWNTEVRGPMGALYFQNQVFEWLFSNVDGKYHMANGNSGNYPNVPALANGNSLCVLLETKSDLIKFAAEFPVRHMEELNEHLQR